MFSNFRHFFARRSTTLPDPNEKPSHIPENNNNSSNDNNNPDGKSIVYVWSGGFFGGLGHVSIATPDGRYISIWPRFTPAGGPFAFSALTAAIEHRIEHDCIRETPRPPEDFKDVAEPGGPTPPDQIFYIEGLNVEAMAAEARRIEEAVNQEAVRYRLLPGFFGYRNEEIYNCVTLTRRLLEAGGMDSLPDASWKTPSGFADELSKQPQVSNRVVM